MLRPALGRRSATALKRLQYWNTHGVPVPRSLYIVAHCLGAAPPKPPLGVLTICHNCKVLLYQRFMSLDLKSRIWEWDVWTEPDKYVKYINMTIYI